MHDSPVDPTVFAELSEAMGEDFARELLDTFLADASTLFAELQRAVDAADAAGYRRASHTLKSNALTFGAVALAEQARDMEHAGVPDGAAVAAAQALFDASAVALRGACHD
ncbi:MAG: Hpt domain-containing protein [Pseudomonadota bacterium]